jgi:hypothetical protein
VDFGFEATSLRSSLQVLFPQITQAPPSPTHRQPTNSEASIADYDAEE